MFSEIEHKFPLSDISFLDNNGNSGVIENKRGNVYTPNGWYKLVETASNNKVFTAIRMKDEFVSLAEEQQKQRMSHNITTAEGCKIQRNT
jgi:hypothetical protein